MDVNFISQNAARYISEPAVTGNIIEVNRLAVDREDRADSAAVALGYNRLIGEAGRVLAKFFRRGFHALDFVLSEHVLEYDKTIAAEFGQLVWPQGWLPVWAAMDDGFFARDELRAGVRSGGVMILSNMLHD